MAAPMLELQTNTCSRFIHKIFKDAFDVTANHVVRRTYFKHPQRLSNRKRNRDQGGISKDNQFGDFEFEKFVADTVQTMIGTPSPSPRNRAPSFVQSIEERYKQARRSVIIRTQSPAATAQTLSSFGQLKYANCISADQQVLLAEFQSERSVNNLMNSSNFFKGDKKFPLVSRSLFDETSRVTNTDSKNKKRKSSVLSEKDWHSQTPYPYPPMATLDEELQVLAQSHALNDLDLRTRFLACLFIEDLVRPLLPDARVLPYGSCFNGFGWWDSDLDMMLCLQGDPYTSGHTKKPLRPGYSSRDFRFLTEVFPTERMLSQKTLSMVGSLLELSPRVNNVYKILNARVPIVRYQNMLLNLSCDISLEAMDSIKMTEMLYLCSTLDKRVQPLMTGIKQWALSQKLTASGEQQKPTTIGLLAMLLFYLQTRVPAVLPTLSTLQKSSAPSDKFLIDGVVYGLPSDFSMIPRSENTESLESLLHGFYEFYSEFDFNSKLISIIEGAAYPKPPDSCPLYVENPFCIGHNICKNVSLKCLQDFTDSMKVAAQKMESLSSGSSIAEDQSTVSALSDGRKPLKSRLSYLFRTDASNDTDINFEVSELFADDAEDLGLEVVDTENAHVEKNGDLNHIVEGDDIDVKHHSKT